MARRPRIVSFTCVMSTTSTENRRDMASASPACAALMNAAWAARMASSIRGCCLGTGATVGACGNGRHAQKASVTDKVAKRMRVKYRIPEGVDILHP